MSHSPEQVDQQATTGLDDLRSRLAVLRTKPVWVRWLNAGLHEIPIDQEWRSGCVESINQLAAELPYGEEDIRVKSYNGYGIRPQVWGITKWAGLDYMKHASRWGELNEAQVTGSTTLDIGGNQRLAVFNLLDLQQGHPYALPATDLAVMIQYETADIVQQPSH